MTTILYSIAQVSMQRMLASYSQSHKHTFTGVGQIELYTHHPFLSTLVQNLSRIGIRTCAVYLIESQFMEDRYKFFR